MDKITRQDISPQTERELTSPLSPKRPRLDCAVTGNCSGKRRFDSPELLTCHKSTGFPSSKNTLQKNEVLIRPAESEAVQDEKLQDTKLIVTPIIKVTAPHADGAHTGSSKVCFITAERHLPHLGKDEQPPLTETDKLSSYPPDDAGEALAEPHTSKDAGTDTSSHPDCKRLGKSLEDEPPGGCCLPAGNDEDGRQVQNNDSQIRAFTLSSSDAGVRCQSDCTYGDALRDAGFCDTRTRSAEVKVSYRNEKKLGFSEDILFSKEEEEGNSHTAPSDYADSKSFYSNPEEDPSGNLAEGVKNERNISELQICENENVAVCDGETKDNVNENFMGRNSIPSVAECAEGSTLSYDVVLARITAAENVSVEVDDFCGAKGWHAAGKMIAKARSEKADHTTENPMPARISQEPVQGANDPGPFSVIDPAICSEADREAEEKLCNSESTAGVKLSPVKVCKMENPLPLCSDVRPSQEVSAPIQSRHFCHQSNTQQCKDKKEDYQSYTEPQACSILINKTHNMAGNESSCHWKSSPSSSPHGPTKPPPAGDGRHESQRTVRHQLKEQDQSSCFPVSLDQMKAPEGEYSLTEIARMDRATEIKEKEDMTSFTEQIKNDKHWNIEEETEAEEELLQQDIKHKESTNVIPTGVCISDCTEDEIGEHDNRLTLIADDETSDEKEGKGKTNAGEEIKTERQDIFEILVKSEDDLQQQNEHKTDKISEWAEGSGSTRGNRVGQVSPHERQNKLSCFPDYQNSAGTLMFDNKDDLLVFTFPPTSDAVVPCQHDLSHSQNANSNPTALNCNHRFSPVPSAFTSCDRVPGGFDTFEKIQFSPDDDEDDAPGPGNGPLLTSLSGQLLKTSQRQLSRSAPGAESEMHEEIPGEDEEEEVERCECHIDNTANEFLSTCNELPNFISEADIIALGWPEQQPNCESACAREHIQDELNPQTTSSTVSAESDSPSDVNACPEFDMKTQFDMVVKELSLYFEISINDAANHSRASSPEKCGDTADALEGDASDCKQYLSSPELGKHHRHTSSDDVDADSSLEVCGRDPVLSCTTGSCDSEQEVPLGNNVSWETSMYAAEKHQEPREMEQRRKMFSPSFMCAPFLGQLSLRPPEQPRRLEPLRTCTRPIRVGLSKRAKTKHLHRPHPYK